MGQRLPTCLSSALLLGAAFVSACGHHSANDAALTLRLGYLTRITHASALVGLDRGLFTKNLGTGVKLAAQPFEQGTAEATALLSGQIDAAYLGANPTFNTWQKSGGTAIKIVAGSAKGGTSFVVKPEIKSAQDLRGKTIADPALGGNHDVVLRSWLQDNGLHTNPQGGGDVFIKPTKPESAIVQEFGNNQIVGAVESAPYDVQMIKAGGVRLWPVPGTVTILVVRQDFLAVHPDAVSRLIRGQVEADQLIHENPTAAAESANKTLARNLGKGLDADVLDASFKETVFTNDPDMASLNDLARKSVSVGLLKPLNLDGLFDAGPLNNVLKTSGKPQVVS